MPRPAPSLLLDFDAWPRVERDDLDGFLAEVADVSGLEAVRFLLSRFGEQKVSVPKQLRDRLPVWLEEVRDHHSVALVRTIIRLRGGETIYIPSPGPLHERAEAREIRRLYNGTNAGDLARRYRRSRGQIMTIALS